MKKDSNLLFKKEKESLEKISEIKCEINSLKSLMNEDSIAGHIEVNSRVLSNSIERLLREKKKLKSIQRRLEA